MRDGRTRPLQEPEAGAALARFLAKFRASLVAVAGVAEGTEIPLDQRRVTLGRGPGVDFAFENESMSRAHAALELSAEGYRVVDLDSTNGVRVNAEPVEAAELHHGDRIELGSQAFLMVIEERESPVRAYVLEED